MSIKLEKIAESFDAIVPHSQEVINRFLKNLLQKHPQLSTLQRNFETPLQQKKLISTFDHIIKYWDERPHVIAVLRKIGASYQEQGGQPEHYEWIGPCLIETLKELFDVFWTSDIEKDWNDFFEFLTKHMSEGMKPTAGNRPQGLSVDHNYESLDDRNQESLEPLVRGWVQNLLLQTLSEEANTTLIQAARKQARILLKKALEEEVRALSNQFNRKSNEKFKGKAA